MQPNSALIGLGNLLMRDEGVGIHVIKYIQENFIIPPELRIIDGGTSGLDLLPFIEVRDYVFFVDAVNFNQEAGYIDVLANEQIPALFGVKDALHHMGLADLLAAARLLERLPQEVYLIGIQPKSIETGLELTPTLQERLKYLVDRVVSQLASRNIFLRSGGREAISEISWFK